MKTVLLTALLFAARLLAIVFVYVPVLVLNSIVVLWVCRYNWPTLKYFWNVGLGYGMWWLCITENGLMKTKFMNWIGYKLA